MRIGELKRKAKASLKGRWGTAIGAFVIYGIINWVVNIPVGSIDLRTTVGHGIISITADLLSFALLLLIIAPLQAGLSWLYLDIYDQENTEVTRIFAGFKQYGKIVGASFFVGLFVILWSLLLIIPGIIKGISYSQTFFVIKENPNIGVFEAIRESRRMMKGHKWRYCLTGLSFIGWVLVPILFAIIAGVLLLSGYLEFGNAFLGSADTSSLGVGYILIAFLLFILAAIYMLGISFYLTPYYQTTMAGFYRELTNKENVEAKTTIFSE